ncbi:PREDICTED: F-box protein PP2-B10 isoform X1 [Theobroma cacao]|uniref:F-box protein PP2-B10 isoform X1 n=1 Tax=Theobroma cacao TaxID=3641 RepID=A0AB32W9T6_THECC|nr:PREDICTED: F-box protein PP2-B10 isoform X1 [Theobroma cacao]
MDMTKVLPDECMSLIISLTSPRDACRMALVSRALRSVADSDAVWLVFLPCDYKQIISKSSSSPSLFSLPKKDLYFSLCHRSILFDDGTTSFRLEKENGKKCYMLGARALSIQWADSPDYWSWIPLPESRFSEVPKLKNVWRLDVKGRIELKTLSYRTNYSAYLVFKIVRDRYGFRHTPVEFRVIINEGTASGKVRSVILDPPPNVPQQAKERGDSWLEIEMGEFFNECGDDTRVEFYLRGVHDNQPKRGLIIEGIELRPKDNRTIQNSKFDSIFPGRHLKFPFKFAKSITYTTLR